MSKFFITLVSLFMFAVTAHALNLKEARQKGFVKELPSGYIEATDPSAKTLEGEVNTKRKAHYQKISKITKTDIKAIGEQAAEKILKKLGK